MPKCISGAAIGRVGGRSGGLRHGARAVPADARPSFAADPRTSVRQTPQASTRNRISRAPGRGSHLSFRTRGLRGGSSTIAFLRGSAARSPRKAVQKTISVTGRLLATRSLHGSSPRIERTFTSKVLGTKTGAAFPGPSLSYQCSSTWRAGSGPPRPRAAETHDNGNRVPGSARAD